LPGSLNASMGSDSSDLVRLGRTCTLLPDFDLANIRPFYSYLDAFRRVKDKPSGLRRSLSKRRAETLQVVFAHGALRSGRWLEIQARVRLQKTRAPC